jgi:hypothetical protein
MAAPTNTKCWESGRRSRLSHKYAHAPDASTPSDRLGRPELIDLDGIAIADA